MTEAWKAATEQGELHAIEALFAAGSDIDALDEHGQTALMNAARDGRLAVAHLLIRLGANLDHHAKYGLTAVMLAVIRDHEDIVRLLVDAGADLSLRGSGAPGFQNRTALDLARARGHAAIVDLLMRGTPQAGTETARITDDAH